MEQYSKSGIYSHDMQHLLVRSILVSNSSQGYQWVCVIALREKTKISERDQFHSYQGKTCLLNRHGNQYTLNTNSDEKSRAIYLKTSDYFNWYRPSHLYSKLNQAWSFPKWRDNVLVWIFNLHMLESSLQVSGVMLSLLSSWRCPQVVFPWAHDERWFVHARWDPCRTTCVVGGAWSLLSIHLWKRRKLALIRPRSMRSLQNHLRSCRCLVLAEYPFVETTEIAPVESFPMLIFSNIELELT